MDAYADYEFYKEAFKGSAIPDTAFDRVALEASFYLNSSKCCMGRITDSVLADKKNSEKIKHAMCAVAETIHVSNEKGHISSESVGKVSTTYSLKGGATEKKKYSLAGIYLADTGLMYRGAYP